MADALQVQVTSTDLRQLYVDLKAVEGNLRVELRKGITAAAKPIVAAVQREASWSSRIPAAVKAKTSFAAKSAGVAITVDSRKAPEAAPLENQGNTGTFRHPVFGTDTWVTQQAQPFFWGGIQGTNTQIDNVLLGVMDTVAREAGFK